MSRYAAFISYSHADGATARWLHRALETYRLPRALVGADSAFGPVPRRLPPIFRDRDELPASGDLGTELHAALADSRFQIVLCSRRAAASKWVDKEILAFKRVHGESRTLALILDGEPYAGGDGECFPLALRFRLGPDGQLSDQPAEPIAADLRKGKDGRRLALLKLVAGIAGVPLDALVRRDAARRQRRLVYVTAASLGVAVVTIGLAIYAEGQRRVAVEQRKLAEKSLDFLVSTFAIANPATENPRTITALTILDRASRSAARELKDEPAVGATLLRATGDIYFNLGLEAEAERDLRAALAIEPAHSEGRARTLLRLAALAKLRSDPEAMARLIDQAQAAYRPRDAFAPVLDAKVDWARAEVEFLRGRYARAAALFGRAAARYQGLDGDYRAELGRVWQNEGEMLVRVHRDAAAYPLFEKAVAATAAKFGANHLMTASALQNQAWADFETGRSALAARRLDRAIAIYDKVLEGDHPTIAGALILAGRIRARTGDAAGALAAFDRAKGMFVRIYGADNAAVGDVDFYAAEAEARAGRLDAALARLANTKRIYDARYGADDPDQAELLLQRARILAGAGRRTEAGESCQAALALQARLKSDAAVLAETRESCAALTAGPGS